MKKSAFFYDAETGAKAAGATKARGTFQTLPEGAAMELEIGGFAAIARGDDGTEIKVVVRGLEAATTYAAHLHTAPCSSANPGGGYYMNDPAGPSVPPNELWLSSTDDPTAGISANSGGVAHGRGSADWEARPEAQSVVIHYIPPGGSTAGGPKIACADLGDASVGGSYMRRLVLIALCAAATVVVDAASARAQGPAVGLRLAAGGLSSPVALVPAPDGSGRRFVLDQTGTVRVLTADGRLLSAPFLDVRSRMVTLMPEFDERGLLGLAFHPGYASNGRFFVYYNAPLRPGAPAGYDNTARISEFRVFASDPNRADPASERVLLEVDDPQFNHNGGTVAFGPRDGYLYISIGDGGGADDVGLGHVDDWYTANAGGNGQDIQHNLLGDILRIDVNRGAPYAIPADNPFTATPGCADGCDETWAYGFRNPYRFSFDMGGGRDLLVGDAGQNLWEEVSIAVRGGNFGWNVKEGAHCFSTENPDETASGCPDIVGTPHPRAGDPLIDPVIEYQNEHNPEGGGLGHVVVGGHVYRGAALRQFSGDYVFGDWSREEEEPDGSLFVAKPRKRGLWKMQQLQIATSPTRRLGHYLLGFGQDLAGEIYVLTSDMAGPSGTTGRVYRLVSASG